MRLIFCLHAVRAVHITQSSLVNALFRSKGLARVSSTPGRTQQLNFFQPPSARGPTFHFVDMPGYGFAARNSKTERLGWQLLVGELLRHPQQAIRCVYVLLDARRGLSATDLEFMHFLDGCDTPFQIVVTKGDQITARRHMFLAAALPLFFNGCVDTAELSRLQAAMEKGGDVAAAACAEVQQGHAAWVASSTGSAPPTVPLFPTLRPWVHVTSTHDATFGLPELRRSVNAAVLAQDTVFGSGSGSDRATQQ
jgi:ribosome biogenesis GTP-binding protein YsxC/EngB